ncbi:5'-nucleotidase [Thelephora ganbajun]|uniref:5'-nucleotidase n=1 Tax=Thelephora ganbajun TaxID=370292 RepID=A0ACB6Z5R2_THEGA|nr:5'-nucleotidase [Thelephora ganbajun]
MPQSQRLKETLRSVLDSVSDSLKKPVAKADVELDLRSQYLRTQEMASSNWFADILRHTYDDVLRLKGCGGADAVFFGAGALRGDSTYGPGNITLGDIMEILPFEDPLVVLELDGETIWAAFEAGLETWPAQEGRFPVIAGFRVEWDSRRPPGQRVLSVHLDPEIESADDTPTHTPGEVTPTQPATVNASHDLAEEVKREKGGRMYKVVTGAYLASGHDGYDMLKGSKYLVEEEGGQIMSTVVRKYLLGSRFVSRMSRLARDNVPFQAFMQADTEVTVQRERKRLQQLQNPGEMHWKLATSLAIKSIRSKRHYRESLNITHVEHMSDVDCFDGEKMRRRWGATQPKEMKKEKAWGATQVKEMKEKKVQDEAGSRTVDEGDLLHIHPVLDGRFKDVGRT